MGEAILVVRQIPIVTPDPTVEVIDETFTSLTIRLTNNYDKDVTIFYEETNTEPSANSVIVAATTDQVTSFSEVTLTGLNSNQVYNIYAYAIEEGQRPSSVVAGQGTTLKYTTEPPIINNVVADTNSVTFDLTNDDDSTATVYYEIDNAVPNSNSISINGKTIIERTLGSLNDGTPYTLYARAQASNENMSSTVSSGFSTQSSSIEATGGSTTDVNIGGTNYRIHAFTSTGSSTFNVTKVPSGETIDVLVVAGGGGGGGRSGGGGGAGGLIYRPNMTVSTGSISLSIGSGGAGGPADGEPTYSGSNSTFGSLTAIGGGAGAEDLDQSGKVGGSGGGGKYGSNGSAGNQPSQSGDSGTYGYGNSGAFGTRTSWNAGGGGGAGGNGIAGTHSKPGDGGPGRYYGNVFGDNFGENGYFAGGGGGGSHNAYSPYSNGSQPGYGGIGGGGDGGSPPGTNARGQNGQANTGGGGGGGSTDGGDGIGGGNGGSGIVLIRYRI